MNQGAPENVMPRCSIMTFLFLLRTKWYYQELLCAKNDVLGRFQYNVMEGKFRGQNYSEIYTSGFGFLEGFHIQGPGFTEKPCARGT